MSSSTEVETFLKKPDDSTTGGHVVEFLNSRFRELEDLEKLDSILSNIKKREGELEEKRVKTQEKTTETLQSSLKAFKSTVALLEGFQATRMDLEEDLTDHCSELTSSNSFGIYRKPNTKTFLQDLILLNDNITDLKAAKQYLGTVMVAEELSNQATQLIEKSPQKALVPYMQLAELSQNIRKNNNYSDGVVGKLDEYLMRTVESLLLEMRSRLTKKFQQTLDALQWPNPIELPYTPNMHDKIAAFRKAFIELLLLQRPVENLDNRTLPRDSTKGKNQELPRLIPIEVMVEPLILRFRYHFDSKRRTNRIDKPEWFFTFVLNMIRDHSLFFAEEVQSILHEAKFTLYNAKNDFIRALLTAITHKLSHIAPSLLNTPQIFSHTVFETLQFDQTLREVHFYVPPGLEEWKGCVEVFTGRKELFKAWLQVERDFAEARYNDIVHAEDAWDIDEDASSEDELRPTKSAEKLIDLLELITSRYKPLPMFNIRIRFLVDIQTELLDAYAKRIESAVNAFESIGHSIMKAVPVAGAVSDNKWTEGVEGLKRLCRWLSAARYVCAVIKEWGEDPFFLDLWHDVNIRAAMNTDVASLPSPIPSVRSSEGGAPDEDDEAYDTSNNDGTIFDGSAEPYDRLIERIERIIVRNVSREFTNEAKAYNRKTTWSRKDIHTFDASVAFPTSHLDPSFDPKKAIEISPELYTPLAQLTHSLTFLADNLPNRLFLQLYKELSKEIEDYLWHRLLMRNQFSEIGGWQFTTDVEKGLFTIGRRWVRKPETYFRRTHDACILLTLPTEKEHRHNTGKHRTIFDVLQILTNNDEPNAIPRLLEELQIYVLNAEEVREVIERRVEVWRH